MAVCRPRPVGLGVPDSRPGPDLPATVPIDTPTGIGVQPEAGPRRPGAGGSESPAEIPTRGPAGTRPDSNPGAYTLRF